MALSRKFFYRKPPDGLLEISERVYVFDCCFNPDVLEEDEYRVYIGGIVAQLREQFLDVLFMVFKFREGENQSLIANILSEYDMTVMDYPRHYEGCPLLTMEAIHHFLRSSESWLSVGHENVLLMHCERGGWLVLAFMLAALLIYQKQYTGEHKTLDMVYKQAPRELMQLILPLNPMPSQLRYLRYITRRNVGSQWSPLDRALTLDCIIIRFIPNLDGEGGCRPIFRIYGQDPFMAADWTPKVLFSTPKRSKLIRYYMQADCELVKIDIHCHIQGDVVLECISLDRDLELEEMMFRIMFNTAFIRSNILMLNRDEIDMLWNVKDHFPKDFRAEVLFSEMDAGTSLISLDLPGIEEKDGLPLEAFAKVQEIFSHVDWLDPKTDVALNVIHRIASSKAIQKLDIALVSSTEPTSEELKSENNIKSHTSVAQGKQSSPPAYASQTGKLLPELISAKHKSDTTSADLGKHGSACADAAETDKFMPESIPAKLIPQLNESGKVIKSLTNMTFGQQSVLNFESSPDASASGKKNEHQELHVALQRPAQSKFITQRVHKASLSPPVPYCSSFQGPPVSISRYQSVPSALGITALLHDHAAANSEEQVTHPATVSPPSHSSSAPDSPLPKSVQSGVLSIPTHGLSSSSSSSSSQSPSSVQISRHETVANTSATLPVGVPLQFSDAPHSLATALPPPPPPPPLSVSGSSLPVKNLVSPPARATPPPPSSSLNNLVSVPIPPPPPPPLSVSRPSIPVKNIVSPPSHATPPPPSSSLNNLVSVPIPPPPPPAPFVSGPSLPVKNFVSPPSRATAPPPSSSLNNLVSVPIPPPPPPPSRGTTSTTKNSVSAPTPPPPPPPPFRGTTSVKTSVSTSTPPPPHPPPSPGTPSFVKNSVSAPSPPPPPPISRRPSSTARTSIAASPPPPPPPPGSASKAASATSSVLQNSEQSAAISGPPPPPPPPLLSRPVSTSAVTSPAAPPPPAPPALSAKESLSKSSAPVPATPPPPLPSGVAKTGGAIPPSSSKDSNGNVPSIPGPPGVPFGAKGRGLSRPNSRNQGQPKKAILKPYHWLKLTRAMQGSLWAEAQKTDEATKAPEFDMSELESLFSAATPTSDHGNSGGKSGRRTTGPKPEKVQLIELRRAYNCEIMLTKVKIPLPDLMNLVLALDDSALDVDQVENLIKFCPTKEEMDLLKGYNGDKENLGKCEQFFLELMKVPRVEAKLRVFSFKIQFHSQDSDLRKNLNTVNSVADEIRNSEKLKRTMQTILSLGNALNHGTARGSAIGFRLDSLLKLSDTRARNNKMTLIHYLCKVLVEKLPELLDFPKDLASLEASTKIQLKYLAEEMQAISKGLEKIVQELTASANDGPVSETFCKMLKEFLGYAEAEVRSLASLYSNVGRNADALVLYFGEDPARCPFEQVVSTLLNFVRMFVRAQEENRKQIELERKKALKEENEKMKAGGSLERKESERMTPPIKSGNIKS